MTGMNTVSEPVRKFPIAVMQVIQVIMAMVRAVETGLAAGGCCRAVLRGLRVVESMLYWMMNEDLREMYECRYLRNYLEMWMNGHHSDLDGVCNEREEGSLEWWISPDRRKQLFKYTRNHKAKNN